MKRADLKGDMSTTDRYLDAAGRARFKGNKALKGTQFLDFNDNYWFPDLVVVIPLSHSFWWGSLHNSSPKLPKLASSAFGVPRLYTWKYAAKVVELGELSKQEVRDIIPDVARLC